VLYLRLSANVNLTILPLTPAWNDGPLPYDRTSQLYQPWQMLTVSDLCTLPVCTWQLLLQAVVPVNLTLTVSPLPTPSPVVPGLPLQASSIACGLPRYFSFSLPHPAMTASVTVLPQGLTPGQSFSLFVSRSTPWPDASSNNGWDMTDPAPPASPLLVGLYGAPWSPVNGSWYAAVFSTYGSNYTLAASAVDPGVSPAFVTSGLPFSSSVQCGASSYWQLPLGALTAQTMLSMMLVGLNGSAAAACQPRLFSTFSYTQPGPLNGWLPPALPYEMFVNTLSSPSQLTLSSTLSSSNLLPLQSQSTLYMAVYGQCPSLSWAACRNSSAGSTTAFSLSASLTERVLLSTDNGPSSSSSFLRAPAGSLNYFQFAFLPSTAPQSAIVTLTGAGVPATSLPRVLISGPQLSPLTDPVVSSAASYNLQLLPPPAQLNFSALMSGPLQPELCAPGAQAACVWKLLVLLTAALPAYSVAVTAYNDGDQTPLSNGATVTSSLLAGQLAYYSASAPAGSQQLVFTLITLDSTGNVDLLLDAVNPHPFYAYNATTGQYAGASWASLRDSGAGAANADVIVLSSNASSSSSVLYVAVFAQRSSAYQLEFTYSQHSSPSSSSSSSSSSTPLISPSSPSSASSQTSAGSDRVLLLSVFIPLLVVLLCLVLLLGVALLLQRHRRRGAELKSPMVQQQSDSEDSTVRRGAGIEMQDADDTAARRRRE
jgi:hypothetical protein